MYNGCCKLHNCEFPECVKGGKPYCPEHTCANCSNIVKTYIPVYHMNRPCVFTLCSQHACQFPSCGTLICDQGKVTCADHTCRWKECTAIVHYGRDPELYRQTYCIKHKCQCDHCSNLVEAGSLACKEHRCKYLACPKYADSHRGYCSEHKCSLECNNIMHKNGVCINHMCAHAGCNSVITLGNRYCPSHICNMDGCRNMALPDKRFCKMHID